MNKVIRCSLLIMILPLHMLAGNDGDQAVKKINKEFNIQSNGRVELFNKYGNMDIAIGESNKVNIDITITATAGNEKKAEDALGRVSVEFEEGSNRIRATTILESNTGWTSWFNIGNVDIDVHYQVSVPADVFLQLENKYGDIYVETTNRDIDIDLSYGGIRLGDINAKLNLDMAYSEGSISQIADGNFELAYSDLEMEDAKDVTMDLKYTDITTGSFQKLRLVSAYSDFHSISVGQIDYSGKYDDLVIEQVNNINATSGFTDINIQELGGEASFEMRYGELKLDNIGRNFSKINITTSYTGVELDFRSDASFTIDVEANYCDIEHSDLKVTENVEKATSRVFKGSRGSGNGRVIARMNYGELRIQ